MDASLFSKMLSDASVTNLKKLHYKYPQVDMAEFIALLGESFYTQLPLRDFAGEPLVWLDSVAKVRMSAAKLLLTKQDSGQRFGVKAMEDEIISTFSIEHIDTSRDSVRRILAGYAPVSETEKRIAGMKRGLEFIADRANKISESSIFSLYQLAIADYLDEENCLLPGRKYRHDSVFVVGEKIEHTGITWQRLPEYMGELVAFINSDDGMNELLKAAVIHFYIAYLHPYFDGNGRMARLMHLWYLVQQGYSSALFVPLSDYVRRSTKEYYNAYSLAEENTEISGVLDVTPFLVYFIENVYHKLAEAFPAAGTVETFDRALSNGEITEKEKSLWRFVLSAYGSGEFSTKQLEKDYGDAAYATIRGFVLKFEKLGLLSSVKYSNRVKYRVV